MTLFSPSTLSIRLALPEDFEELYALWMQKHILPFMAFEQLTQEQFRPVFDKLLASSKVYVAIDEGTIVGVRKLYCGEGHQSHIAFLGAFGVHEDHLRKGIGSFLYKELFKIIRNNYPQISIIQLTQEFDNLIAPELAKRFLFQAKGAFPDWLIRETGLKEYTDKWLTGERYFECLLDENILNATRDRAVFEPILPKLLETAPTLFSVVHEEGEISCYQENKRIGSCKISQGESRYNHIQFWNINLEPNADLEIVEQFLRQVIIENQDKTKKIEIFTHEETVIGLLEKLGFHSRAKLTASIKIDDNYFNQIGADYSFFDIEAAKKVLEYSNESRVDNLLLLEECKKALNEDKTLGKIDAYGQSYLENLVFQMVREVHGESFYAEDRAPWGALIRDIPETLACKTALMALASELNASWVPAVKGLK